MFLRIAWWVLFQARIGPVVATLTGTHGVHAGDVLGVASLVLATAFSAAAYVSVRHRRLVFALVHPR